MRVVAVAVVFLHFIIVKSIHGRDPKPKKRPSESGLAGLHANIRGWV